MPQELHSQNSNALAVGALRDQIEALQERAVEADLVGWKIALNSPAVQKHLGIPGPLLDFLTSDTVSSSDDPIGLYPNRDYLVEAECYVVLAADVSRDPSPSECRDAIGRIGVAIEILDVSEGPHDVDWILRNHSYHYAARIGPTISASSMPTLAQLSLNLSVGTNPSLDIDRSLLLGEFPEVVGFSARQAAMSGRGLQSSDIILCGSLNPVARVKPGQAIAAKLRPIGQVRFETIELPPNF